MIFLFTDIDHPELIQQKGSSKADHLLACQIFLIEETLSTHGASWLERTPQGVKAAFEQGDPAGAALALQKEFQSHLWDQFGKAKLRLAFHAGEAELLGQTYVGPDIDHTLKLLEAAWGGQVLLSVAAVHFIPLPPGSRLVDLGPHFLKDLSEPKNVYILKHPDLTPEDHPPLRSLQQFPQNFLPQGSPFFGREEEKKEIFSNLLNPSVRLLTLVGPGGFGKTRLALQTAAEAVEHFPDGVYMVPLAPLLSNQLLVGSIAHALKFFFYGPQDPKTQLVNYLASKTMLLILDNFEHIIEGAELVEEILSGTQNLKILITSREGLRLEGEKIFEVRGLNYPSSAQDPGLEASGAIQLFIKSARRVKPDSTLKPEDREPILQICRLLEGMPLGLELSATWVATLSPSQIADKIESSRDFLATSMPHLPPRHRSLRAVFEYSWILLDESQKRILKAISVFKGGFTEPAARKVAGATEGVLDYLENKSLVRKRPDGRYEVHELLKYYAKEKLYDDPLEKERIMDAHCAYFASLLQKREKKFYGSTQRACLEEMIGEIGNLREGWTRAVESSLEKQQAQFLEGYFILLETKGWFQEARQSFQRAAQFLEERYQSGPPIPDSARTLLSRHKAKWAFFENLLGEPQKAQKLFQECLQTIPPGGARYRGFILDGLAIALETLGHYEKAKLSFEQALKAYQKLKDPFGLAWSLNHLGHIHCQMGHPLAALPYVKRAMRLCEVDRDERCRSYSLNLMGDIFFETGRYEEGREFYQKGLAGYLETMDRRGTAWSFMNLGRVAQVMGDFVGARQMFQESQFLSHEMGDLRAQAWAQSLVGEVAWALGDYRDAFELYSQSRELYQKIGDLRGEAWVLDWMGNVKMAQWEDREAESYYLQAFGILSQEGPNLQNRAWHLYHLGCLEFFRKNFPRAREYFRQGLSFFEKIQESQGRTTSLIRLGELAVQEKDFSGAKQLLRKAAASALKARLQPFLADLLVVVAQLLKAQGDEHHAISLLMVALTHPTCRRQTKDQVVSLVLELKSHFSSEEVEGAQQWAKAARIEDVASAWATSDNSLRKGKTQRTRPKAKDKTKRRP